jgi:hypothetical protein
MKLFFHLWLLFGNVFCYDVDLSNLFQQDCDKIQINFNNTGNLTNTQPFNISSGSKTMVNINWQVRRNFFSLQLTSIVLNKVYPKFKNFCNVFIYYFNVFIPFFSLAEVQIAINSEYGFKVILLYLYLNF